MARVERPPALTKKQLREAIEHCDNTGKPVTMANIDPVLARYLRSGFMFPWTRRKLERLLNEPF